MNEELFYISTENFIDQVTRKFQAYAIIDIENKMLKLLRTETRHENLEMKLSELIDKKNYYERASNDQLLADLLESAKERYEEEPISYAKQAFDLLLSKKQFNSYH